MPKRKNKKRNPVADRLLYVAVRVTAMFMYMVPCKVNYVTARILGDILYRFYGRGRHRAIEHVRRSFPDWTEDRIKHVARESMRSMAYLAIEMLFTPKLITQTQWRKRIELVNMEETLRILLEHKTGAIMLTGHFGNWEVVGYTMAALGLPTYSVARRQDNPLLDEFIFGVRERAGQVILDKRGATARIPELMANKETVCFIADQDAGRKGVFVDFFGRKASTYKSIALLAMQHEVPIVVGYAKRLGARYKFEIGVCDVIHPADWADADHPVKYITQRYSAALEKIIRTAPGQYLWTHRRWKHRPKGEEQPADGIA